MLSGGISEWKELCVVFGVSSVARFLQHIGGRNFHFAQASPPLLAQMVDSARAIRESWLSVLGEEGHL